MPWTNEDAYNIGDLEYDYATREDVPVYTYGELPDTSSNNAPVVAILSPTVGSAIGKRQALVFTVTDADGHSFVLDEIHVQTGGTSGSWFVVWREGAATPGFSVTRTAITNGYQFSITRDAGWDDGVITLEPVFADAYGGISGV